MIGYFPSIFITAHVRNNFLAAAFAKLMYASFLIGIYDSTECSPDVMECRLFHSHLTRKSISCRESLRLITEGRKSKSDQGLIDNIKVSGFCLAVMVVESTNCLYLLCTFIQIDTFSNYSIAALRWIHIRELDIHNQQKHRLI